MVQALVQINSVSGSNPPNGTAIDAGDTITLNNLGNGGETTWLWEFLDVPPNSGAAFSNANIQSPTFVADCEGTYLLRVTVNRLLASEQSATAIVGVAQLRSGFRVPAALETTQYNAKGWSQAANAIFRKIDQLLADANLRVGVADGALVRGQVVSQRLTAEILVGLPDNQIIAAYSRAYGNTEADATGALFIVESHVNGASSIPDGEMVVVRASGLIGPLTPVPLPDAAQVYLSDTGELSDAAGTFPRRLGRVVTPLDGNDWVQFDGAAAGLTLPVGRVFAVTATYSASSGDVVLCNANAGAFTVTLPNPSSVLSPVSLKKTDPSVNAVTVAGFAGETIDGALSRLLTVQYESVTLWSDGINWWVG